MKSQVFKIANRINKYQSQRGQQIVGFDRHIAGSHQTQDITAPLGQAQTALAAVVSRCREDPLGAGA